jgi:hypothetical protein
MNTPQELYTAVKTELAALAGPLFERSEKLLRERGHFLPHAAVLSAEGKVALVGAMCSSSSGKANPETILPMLYNGLRAMAHERPLLAIGVAESVTVNMEDGSPTQAIKVHIEHSEGLTLAFFLPFLEEAPGEFAFGASFSSFEPAEISAWQLD